MRETPIAGGGTVLAPAEPGVARAALLEPAILRHAVPGAETLEHLGGGRYRAVISLGVGPLRVRQTVELTVAEGEAPGSLALTGTSHGALAHGRATGHAVFETAGPGRTRIRWRYEGAVGGVAALTGRTALVITARAFAARFFSRLRARLEAGR